MDSYEDDIGMHFSEQELQMYFAKEDTPHMSFSLEVDTSVVGFDGLNQIPRKSVICAEQEAMAAQSGSASAFKLIICQEPETMAAPSVSASTTAQNSFGKSASVFLQSLDSLAYCELRKDGVEGELSEDGVKVDQRLKMVAISKVNHRGNKRRWNKMVPLALLNKLWGADIESPQLLPGIPDQIFLEEIASKLPLRDFLKLSLMSKSWQRNESWQQAVQMRKARLVIDFHQMKVL